MKSGGWHVVGSIRYVMPLVAVFVAACAAEPAATSAGSRLGNRSAPVLDQGIPPELSAATFAMG